MTTLRPAHEARPLRIRDTSMSYRSASDEDRSPPLRQTAQLDRAVFPTSGEFPRL
ncbi:hypothetical protein [Humibacter soli]